MDWEFITMLEYIQAKRVRLSHKKVLAVASRLKGSGVESDLDGKRYIAVSDALKIIYEVGSNQ